MRRDGGAGRTVGHHRGSHQGRRVNTALLAYAFTVALFLYVFGDFNADSHTRLKHVGLSLVWPLTLAYVVATFLREKAKER